MGVVEGEVRGRGERERKTEEGRRQKRRGTGAR
jgi:hypothetical protein